MSSEAKLSCEICHKKFKFSSTYKIHVNKHTRASTKRLQYDQIPKLTQHLKADNQIFTRNILCTQNSKDLKQLNFDEENVIRQQGMNLINETVEKDAKKNLIAQTSESSHLKSKNETCLPSVENLTAVDVNMEVENKELSDLQKSTSQDIVALNSNESAGQPDCQSLQKRNLRKRSKQTKGNTGRNKTGHKEKKKKEKVNQVFACTICQKFFSNKQNLVAHKSKHLGVRHKCDQCGLTYSSKYSLKTHLLWHKNLKPWECEQCGAQFLQNGHYKRHLKIHSGERDEICEQCGKSFPGRDGLRAHKQTHVNNAGFECHVCGVRLKLKSSMRNHMKLHKEEKEYTCNVCKRSFSQKKCYLNHKKLHNSSYVKRKAYLKPILERCELCNKGFVNSSGLKKHMRKHELGLLKRFNSLNLDESQRISTDMAIGNNSRHGSGSVERFEIGSYKQVGISSTVFVTEKGSSCNPGYVRQKSEKDVIYDKPFGRNSDGDWSQQQTVGTESVAIDSRLVPSSGHVLSDNLMRYSANTVHTERRLDTIQANTRHAVNKSKHGNSSERGSGCLHTDARKSDSPQGDKIVVPTGQVEERAYQYSEGGTACLVHVVDKCDVFKDNDINTDKSLQTEQGISGTEKLHDAVVPSHSKSILFKSHNMSETIQDKDLLSSPSVGVQSCKLTQQNQNRSSVQEEELSQEKHSAVQLKSVGSKDDGQTWPIITHLNGSLRTFDNCYENVTPRTDTNVMSDALETPLNALGLGSDKYDGLLEQADVNHQPGSERETENKLGKQNSYRTVVSDDTDSDDGVEESTDQVSDTETAEQTYKTSKNLTCTQQAQGHSSMEVGQAGSSGIQSVLCGDTSSPKKKCRKKYKMINRTTHAKSICEHCGKTFSQTNHLYRHIRLRSCLKPYECSLCCRAFRTSGSLLKHMRKDHNMRFVCNLCDKSFASSSSLHKHKKYHVNDSPYLYVPKLFECKICGNRYTASSSLKTHLLQHKGYSYTCNFCGKEYGQKSHLARHISTVHHGIKHYKCDFNGCNKGFVDSRALLVHKRSHSGEKPYQCNSCGKFFTESQNLKVHMKKHSNVKEFKCNICEQEFTTKMSMLRHYKRHERDTKDVESAGQSSRGKRRVKKMAEKTLSCSRECGGKFTTRRGLIAHMKKHCPLKNSSGADNSLSRQAQNDLLENNVNMQPLNPLVKS